MDSSIGQCTLTNPSRDLKSFTFDSVYFMESTAEQIYNDIVYPLVEVRKYNTDVLILLINLKFSFKIKYF